MVDTRISFNSSQWWPIQNKLQVEHFHLINRARCSAGWQTRQMRQLMQRLTFARHSSHSRFDVSMGLNKEKPYCIIWIYQYWRKSIRNEYVFSFFFSFLFHRFANGGGHVSESSVAAIVCTAPKVYTFGSTRFVLLYFIFGIFNVDRPTSRYFIYIK